MSRWHNGGRGQERDATLCRKIMDTEARRARRHERVYYAPLDLLAWFQHKYPRFDVRPSHQYQIAVSVMEKI